MLEAAARPLQFPDRTLTKQPREKAYRNFEEDEEETSLHCFYISQS